MSLKCNNTHVPVLLGQVVEQVSAEFGSLEGLSVFDGTLGGGGYSRVFLEKGASVVGSDLDQAVVDSLNKTFAQESFEALQGNFSEIVAVKGDSFFDVVVVDLGYSSNQLDHSKRGFSYMQEEEVFDLRYDISQGQAAWEYICGEPVENLGKVIYTYSGETFSHRIARSLKEQEVRTVGDVKEAVTQAIPQKYIRKKNAILSRVWQSLRIVVNKEFEHLEVFLERSLEALKPGGLLMVVDFHSLEDKIVTKFMRDKAKPVSEDTYGNKEYAYSLLTKKGLLPSEQETEENVRARSATLRILKKLK